MNLFTMAPFYWMICVLALSGGYGLAGIQIPYVCIPYDACLEVVCMYRYMDIQYVCVDCSKVGHMPKLVKAHEP